MTALPDDARRQNLGAAANPTRLVRSRVLRGLRDGTTDPCDVIADPPACIGEMFLPQLLLACRGIGKARVESLGMLAWRDGIALYVRVGRLSPFAREWVVRTLRTELQPRSPSGRRARARRVLHRGTGSIVG